MIYMMELRKAMIVRGTKFYLFLPIILQETVFKRHLAVHYLCKDRPLGPSENHCLQKLMKFCIIQVGVSESADIL